VYVRPVVCAWSINEIMAFDLYVPWALVPCSDSLFTQSQYHRLEHSEHGEMLGDFACSNLFSSQLEKQLREVRINRAVSLALFNVGGLEGCNTLNGCCAFYGRGSSRCLRRFRRREPRAKCLCKPSPTCISPNANRAKSSTSVGIFDGDWLSFVGDLKVGRHLE
jgi:hypothetical protein